MGKGKFFFTLHSSYKYNHVLEPSIPLCRKIQSVFELSDGSGLVVTVARYETPAHTDIDKV